MLSYLGFHNIPKKFNHYSFLKNISFHARPAESLKLHAWIDVWILYLMELKLCTMIERHCSYAKQSYCFWFLTQRLCKQSKGLCCGADYANDIKMSFNHSVILLIPEIAVFVNIASTCIVYISR